MGNTDLLLGFLIFLLVAISIPVGFAYLAEWYTQKALQSHSRFQNSKGKLENFEKDLDREASNWPIYARPVLFTSIDKETQKTFGMAQQALIEAQRIAREFPAVPPRPDEPLEAFSPDKCARRIQICDEIIQLEAEFRKWLGELEGGKRALAQHYKEQGVTVEGVERQLAALKIRLSETEKKAAAITHGKEFNETIGWVVNYAQIGTHASEARIAAPGDNGLLNYAIADTFIRLTNYLLEHFELTETDVSFSDKFILDQFENRLRDFEINLRKVVEAKVEGENGQTSEHRVTSSTKRVRRRRLGEFTRFTTMTTELDQRGSYQQAANAIETWEDVAQLDAHLEVLSQKLERASSSFTFFLRKQAVLLNLIEKISGADIPKFQAESARLESECQKYWGEYAASPLHWREALRGSKLPSLEFNEARECFLTDILHHLERDAKIKQSEMTRIISTMTYFLAKVGKGEGSFGKLAAHLKVHKDAEVIVNSRLGINGTTTKLVKTMEDIKSDYSTNNQKRCTQHRGVYDDLLARAQKVTGANFPAMLGELDVFEGKCHSLIAKHQEEISDLHQKCGNNSRELRARRNIIEQFKEAAPRVGYDFSSIESTIIFVLKKDYINNFNHRSLQGYLKETGDTINDADQIIDQINVRWGRFIAAEESAYELIAHNSALLGEYQNAFSISWMWVKQESSGILEHAIKKIEQFSMLLSRNRDPQLNLSIEQAMLNCQKIDEELENINLGTVEKLREIKQQQNEFGKTFNALMDMVDKPIPPIYYMFQIRPKVPAKLKELCLLATQVNDRKQVKYLLNSAEAYFEKQLTEEEAENIIQKININYGVIIGEQNNQAGSTVNNSGRDINYYGD